MDQIFKLEIATPQGKVFEGDVEELLAPATQGEIGVLPGHTPLLTTIEPGPLAVRQGGKLTYYAVHGGFCEVDGKGAAVLAEAVEVAGEVDRARAEAALKRAQERLQKLSFSDVDYADTLAALRRASARLSVIGK